MRAGFQSHSFGKDMEKRTLAEEEEDTLILFGASIDDTFPLGTVSPQKGERK